MLRHLTSRRLLPVVAVLAVALSVAGCGKDKKNDSASGSGDQADSCGYQSGDASNAVQVGGDFGKDLTTTFDKPLSATSLQRTIVTTGDGADTKKGDNLSVVISLFSGKDGKLLDHETRAFVVGDAQVQDSLKASLECVKIGSRVVTTFAAKDLLGDAGNPQLGIAGTDGLVLVTDVVEIATPPKASDWASAPSVTFNGRQSPQVTVPSTVPAELSTHVIKAGDGAVVGATDTITINYKGINSRTGKVFDETYGKGKAPVSYPVNQFVPGFTAALVGQKAGTQLIVAIPPKYGYGDTGNAAAGIKGTDTMVFVIEIQATKPAA